MIFITVGSQKFQFNRLLIEIDRLIKEKKIKEEVFAQIGYSDYMPQKYNYKKFLDKDEFDMVMSKCDIVITHGGTGAIIGALKRDKKVIAVPRLAKYGEHVDNHQVELLKEFKELNFIEAVDNIYELQNAVNKVETKKYNKYISNTNRIIDDIVNYLGEYDEVSEFRKENI